MRLPMLFLPRTYFTLIIFAMIINGGLFCVLILMERIHLIPHPKIRMLDRELRWYKIITILFFFFGLALIIHISFFAEILWEFLREVLIWYIIPLSILVVLYGYLGFKYYRTLKKTISEKAETNLYWLLMLGLVTIVPAGFLGAGISLPTLYFSLGTTYLGLAMCARCFLKYYFPVFQRG